MVLFYGFGAPFLVVSLLIYYCGAIASTRLPIWDALQVGPPVGALFCASIDVVLLLTVRSYLDKINNITVYWIGVLALCLLKCVKDEVKTIYDDKFFKTITFDKINKIVNA